MRQPQSIAAAITVTALLVAAPQVPAEITRTVVTAREAAYEGVTFDGVGPYEWLIGYAEGELDPDAPRNLGIVNLDRAPRNARGRVEYRVDLQILKPVDLKQSSGRLFYDVVNRGNKRSLGVRVDGGPTINDPRLREELGTGFLLRSGYVLAWSGWQADVPEGDGRMRASYPVAVNEDGAPITARHREEAVFDHNANPAVLPLSYPAASLAPGDATLTVRQHERDPRQQPADLHWSYVSPTQIRIQRPDDFDAGAIYEFIYPARDPVVMGIAFAAVRDVTSFLRYSEVASNPLAGHIEKAMAMGISQSGRFLRDMLYQDFNIDEQERIVFDGMIPIVAGSRRTQVNRAFSVPGRFSRQHEDHSQPDHEFPFAYQTLTDSVTGRRDGLLARCEKSGSCPRVFHVDTDSELFSAGASLIVTDTRGRASALPGNVRAYLMAGSEHAIPETPDYPGCQRPRNPLNYAPHTRALIAALDAWISHGTPPPGSRFPSAEDGTLVPPTHPRAAFPSMPGFRYSGLTKQPRVFDFATQPPTEAPGSYPVLVGAKDADGNNLAGVRHPFLQVPAATHTGWNLRKAGYAENALCSVLGSHVPFARTRAEREATQDQRPSLEERYPSLQVYVDKAGAAIDALRDARLLLPEDADRLRRDAAQGPRLFHRIPLASGNSSDTRH